jgi:PAS domain S-box-containing protein
MKHSIDPAFLSRLKVVASTEELRELLAAVVDSSSDAIITLGLRGEISSWNRGAEKVFGYTAEEALGQSILMLRAPERLAEDVAQQERIDKQIDDRGSVANFDAVRLRKNGERIHISVAVSPVSDSQGNIFGRSVVARDITDRKRAEEALRESEKRFQTLANGISQLAWMAEADGFVFWYNQRWYEYTGRTLEEMKGWGWQSCHDPNVLPQVLKRWTSSIATGEPFEMEYPLLGASGRWRTFLTRVMPLKNENGQVVRWLGTNTDITDRKQAEVRLAEQASELTKQAEELRSSQQALEAQRSMLQSVLESIGGGLVTADAEGKYNLWNPADNKTAILDPSDLASDKWTAHYSAYLPGAAATVATGQNPLLRAMQGEVSSAELFVPNPDLNRGVWIESSGTPVRDKNGVVQGSVVAFRDITQRKAQELEIRKLNENLEENIAARNAQLKAANEELEAFTYSVSHDLRAPLRHIGGFSRILMEDFATEMPAGANAHVQRIEEAVHRAGLMVDGLLSLARLGRQSLTLRLTPLNAIVDEVMPFLEGYYEGREVEWRIARLPSLACDQVMMGQVFQNLLSNAIKYSRGKTPAVIEIDSIQTPDKPAIIFVRDNGAGFSMKYADKLFGVFQRLHTEAEFEGTGVGLATSHRIIQKHGGSIWAEAEPDCGATFYFTVGTDEVTVPAEPVAIPGK